MNTFGYVVIASSNVHKSKSFFFSISAIDRLVLQQTHIVQYTLLSKMPNTTIQTGQDWGAVNVGRASANRVNVPKSAAGVSRMKALGLVSTEKKYGAGGNASAHSGAGINARKIEESDELKHDKVDKKLSVAIQQARMAKKMTQKDLGKERKRIVVT